MARALFALLFVATASLSATALTACSGHGQIYSFESSTFCQCDPCYAGPACERLQEGCLASVGIVELSFLQSYWNAASDAAVQIPAGYRLSYQGGEVFDPKVESPNDLTRQLDKEIRDLHASAGPNVRTDGYYIVPGFGASSFLSGAIFAYSTLHGKHLNVSARLPAYGGFSEAAEGFFGAYGSWGGGGQAASGGSDVEEEKEEKEEPGRSASSAMMEFITYPNNPDGARNLTAEHPSAFKAYDMVYYWPSFTTVDKSLDLPFAFFSLGKLGGFAGSHFGWAVVKEKALAERLAAFIDQAGSQSVDSRVRALAILRHLNRNSSSFFKMVKGKLKARWAELALALNIGKDNQRDGDSDAKQHYQQSFSIMNQQREGLFAWIRCNGLQGNETCQDVFESAGISVNGPGGPILGVPNDHVRMTLCNFDSNWALALDRMKKLRRSP